MEYTYLPDELGRHKDTESRLKDLQSRLLAWELEGQLDELWAAAMRRYKIQAKVTLDKVREDPRHALQYVTVSSSYTILDVFEAALEDMDQLKLVAMSMEGNEDLWVGGERPEDPDA